MKESEFIDQNKNKWFEYETLLKQNSADPEALSEVFIQVTDDLSYSRTHYPNRSVRVYLNNLARFIFDKIGKRKRFDLKNMLKFFRIEVPQLFYKARFEMLISFGVFMLAFVIGVYSSAQDEGFAKLILGDAYVAITDQNINNDDPMAIYRTGKGIDSFLGILINNARVDILMLSLGMIFGVGALFVLISNGIMVGAFQYYFYAHGGFEESLATIWMHGTIEITTIILIGGVGMMAGKGLLFPRSYTRFQSFRISASNAAKLLLAVLPFTFVAALIEGFLTRQTTAPFAMKLGVIVLSLIVVVGYFIIYPYFVNKRYGSNVIHETLRNPAASKPIDLHEIKSPAAVISEAFKSYKSNTKLYLSLGFAVASGLVVFVYVFWAEYFVNLANPFFNFLFETVSKDVFKTNPEMSSIVSQGGQLNPWGFAASISAVFALVVA
ncbi:MAG: putative membrane protein SpoIIM required for sporulation, partial [Bacteroidia bacterium]